MRPMLIAVLALFAAVQSAPGYAAKPDTGFLVQQVKGTLSGGGTFDGSVLIEKIVPEGLNSKQVRVVGKITGNAITPDGTVQKISDEPFSTPATLTSDGATSASAAQNVCSILHLDLGPINLNVLGLMLTTNEIVINLTAIQNGGLLGNLLCSLANALANGTHLKAILAHLNHLLNTILATL